MTCDLCKQPEDNMRRIPLLLAAIAFSSALQAYRPLEYTFHIPQKCHGSDQTDLIPVLRVGVVPRFFNDTTAIAVLGELGRQQNRINATLGFPLAERHHFKFGGEMLNEELSYHFPYDHAKAWTRQYAAGAAYRMDLNFWGFTSLEVSGRWSNAQGRQVHKFQRKPQRARFHAGRVYRRPSPNFYRSIGDSKAYGFTAGLSIEPWYWAVLSASGTYDKVDYSRKHMADKVVSGFGGIVSFEQRFTPSISLGLKGEFRAPYTYYEGNLKWTAVLCSTDVSVGIFGGHTQGRRNLPSSTVAGIEIGFDFGLTGCSVTRSVGVCGNSPDYFCRESICGQSRNNLQWQAAPAVYMPEVLAISQQYRTVHVRQNCAR